MSVKGIGSDLYASRFTLYAILMDTNRTIAEVKAKLDQTTGHFKEELCEGPVCDYRRW